MILEEPDHRYFNSLGPFVVNAPQPLVCSLGQIVYAGTKWNSRAIPMHILRRRRTTCDPPLIS